MIQRARVLKYRERFRGMNLARNFEDLHVYDAALRVEGGRDGKSGKPTPSRARCACDFRSSRARLRRAGRNVNARY